jgi:hypothetical protein
MIRYWTCRKCSTMTPRRKQKCQSCGGPRPVRRRPKHMAALDLPYEAYVELNGGEHCGICGTVRKPGGNRLHRDHDHRTGLARGILCFRCNAALRPYMTLVWLRAAVKYVERAGPDVR